MKENQKQKAIHKLSLALPHTASTPSHHFRFRPDENPRTAQLQSYHNIANSAAPVQRQAAQGGLPGQLKSGIESLSGLAMNDVRVHYNSSKPAQLQAHAYAQGTDIHIAPGQERHLPHEAWHVVQQKQGRVKPTLQLKGIAVNDDSGLEREADVMGGRAMQMPNWSISKTEPSGPSPQIVQRVAFTIGGKPKDTKDYTYDRLRQVINTLELRLDLPSLESLYKALGEPKDDAQLKMTKDQRESLEAHINNHSFREVNEVGGFVGAEERRLLDRLATDAVDAKQLGRLQEVFADTLARRGWDDALGNLELLADAVPNALAVNSMKKKLLTAGLIDREGDAKSDAKQNVAGAILDLAGQGMVPMPAWSVSGSKAKSMTKPDFGHHEVNLETMWNNWTGMDKGRYHSKAKSFFGRNTQNLEHERSMDSEVQLLDYYLQELLGAKGPNNAALGPDAAFDQIFPPRARAKVLGSLVIHSDRTPCLSCATMIDVFRRDFPGIVVFITYARDYQSLAADRSVQEVVTDGQAFAYRNVDDDLLPIDQDTDGEAREKQRSRALEAEAVKKRQAEVEKKRQGTIAVAKDFKTAAAQKFLDEANLKPKEREILEKFFAAGTANHRGMLRDIAAKGNAQAKMQAIQENLKSAAASAKK